MSAQLKQNDFSDNQSSVFLEQRRLTRLRAKQGNRNVFHHLNTFDDYMSYIREVESLNRRGETLVAVEMEQGKRAVIQTLLSSESALRKIANIPRELRLKNCNAREIFDEYEKPESSSLELISEETLYSFTILKEEIDKMSFYGGFLEPSEELSAIEKIVQSCHLSFGYFESLALAFFDLHQAYQESRKLLKKKRSRCLVSDKDLARYCEAFCDRQSIDWTTCPIGRRSLVDYLFASTSYREFVKQLEQKHSLTPELLESLVAKLSGAYRRYEQAKSELIRANLGLVVSIAKRFANKGFDMMDLIQEGSLGLIRAVEKFEYQRGHKFATYASWWIRQAICRAIFEQGHMIRIPTHLAEVVKLINRATLKLEQRYGRFPTLEELSEETGIELERISELQSVTQRLLSFNEPLNEDGDGEFGDFVEDSNALTPEESLMNEGGLQEITDTILSSLSPREEKVIRMRYGIGERASYTLDDIGRNFNLTRERIRQIELSAIEKMRQTRQFEKLSKLVSI